MEFRLLGPLEVLDQGRPLAVTAPKHRALLAALLVNADEVVSVDRLVDYLWGERAPATASSLVKVYVSQVRHLLAGGAGATDLLVTQAPGYRLRVAVDALDLLVFEQLVAEAESAQAEGRTELAAERLRAALDLWRGEPLEDVPSDLLRQVDATRLTERRLAAVEARIEADLLLGRDRELVGELEALVAAHPLRERLRGQLMLALYRSGRRADALAVYQAARATMAEELGLDPDPELRRLQRAILSEDPSLTLPRATTEVASVQPPSQLPPLVADFTGRADVCQQLRRVIEDGLDREDDGPVVMIAAVAGKAGVGKTTVAVRVAHRLRSRFPDGQLYVDLRGCEAEPLDPSGVLAAFLRALGVGGIGLPEGLDERAQLYRTRLAERRVLVVLDNAASEAQVRPLLPAGGGCAVLVTSRRPLAGLEAANTVALDVFTPIEAQELLVRLVGDDRLKAEPEAAEAIAVRCGHLPLAVRISGAKLATKAHWTLDEYADRLADERRRLDELVAGDLEVRSSVALSYRSLGGAEQRAVRLLGLLDAIAFAGWVLAPLLGLRLRDEAALEDIEDLVERLVDAQLLDVTGHDETGQVRYRFHDLLRDFARERVLDEEPAAIRSAAIERLNLAYLSLAEDADALLGPRRRRSSRATLSVARPFQAAATRHHDRLRADPIRWLEAERVGLVAAVEQAGREGSGALTWRLAAALAFFLEGRAWYDDYKRTNTAALAAARGCGNAEEEAWIMLRLGWLNIVPWLDEGGIDALQATLDLFRSNDDRAGIAYALQSLGELHTELNSYPPAAAFLTKSLDLFRELDDPHGEAVTRCHIGEVYDRQCRYASAVDHFSRCADTFRALGDRRWEAYSVSYLAMVYRNQGRPDLALPPYEQSLSMYRQIGDRQGVAEVTRMYALALSDLARFGEAEELVEEALRIAREIGYRRWEAACLHTLGEVLRNRGEHGVARDCYDQCLGMLYELGDPRLGKAETLRSLGHLARAEGRHDEALAHLNRCLPLLQQVDYLRGQAFALHDLGALHAEVGHFEEAARSYSAAIGLFQAMGHESGEADSRTALEGLPGATCWR